MSTNHPSQKVYYMFNKPIGCITAHTDQQHKTVMDYFKEPMVIYSNLHPVGRLDKDTEGMLLITNDGQFNQCLMLPESHVTKTYEFLAMGNLTNSDIEELENGIYFTGDAKKTAPCKITIHQRFTVEILLTLAQKTETTEVHKQTTEAHRPILDCHNLLKFHMSERTMERLSKNRPFHPMMLGTITITEGRKHHIKRLIKHAGGCVVALKRISIGRLSLDNKLKPGEYRELSSEELQLLL